MTFNILEKPEMLLPLHFYKLEVATCLTIKLDFHRLVHTNLHDGLNRKEGKRRYD